LESLTKARIFAVKNIQVEMKEVQWSYRQVSFPRAEDKGTATVSASSIYIELAFDIIPSGLGIPTLQVHHFDAKVGKFDIKFGDSKVRSFLSSSSRT